MFRASSRGLIVNSGDLRHILLSYMNCYNEVRTHLSLGKDAPTSRRVQRAGQIVCRLVLCGLVCTENLNPAIMVMKSAKDGA
jgi:hypothetical protein